MKIQVLEGTATLLGAEFFLLYFNSILLLIKRKSMRQQDVTKDKILSKIRLPQQNQNAIDK
jgi:hypothetical protein